MFVKLKELQSENPNITVEMFRLKQNQKALIKDAKDGVAGTISAANKLQEEGKLEFNTDLI